MLDWRHIFRLVHDNIAILFFALVIAVCGLAWLMIEAYRSHRSRNEIFKLRSMLQVILSERISPPASIGSSHWFG